MGASAKLDAVLIFPPFINYFAGPPLGIASLSAAVQDSGYRCQAWDVNAEFIDHVARQPALLTELSWRLAHRLDTLYRQPTLDYYSQQEARAVIDALDTAAPVVGPLLAGDAMAEDGRIVGDHDKDLPSVLLMQLAALEAFSSCEAPFQESYQAEISPAHAVRLATAGGFGLWGEFVRQRLIPRLRDLNPRLVGFSLMDVTQVLPLLFLAHVVKTALPHAFVIAGGSYISAIKDKVASLAPCHPIIDAFSCAEGETALSRLLERLVQNLPLHPALPNLALWDGMGYRWNEVTVVEDLERLPVPDFDSLNLDIYRRSRQQVPIPLITSKGCVYGKCTYCTYTYQEPVNRDQSLDTVLTGLQTLERRYGVRTFSLKDSLLTTTRARALAERLCGAGLDITWNFQSKISAGFTPALVKLLEASGCRTIEFGVETPNARLQKMIRKPAPLDMIEGVLRNFAHSRITVIFNMMYGLPTESEEEAAQALAWVSSIPPRHPHVHFASVNHMLNISRHAALHAAAENYGIQKIGEWPWATDAEWVTPSWHRTFQRRIAKVLHQSDSPVMGQVFTILAHNRHRRRAPRYSRPVLEARLGEAEEQIERIRLERRILRAQAAAEYARLSRPLSTAGLIRTLG